MLTAEQITESFSNISSENMPSFLGCFAENLKSTWTGVGSPFAGTYNSRDELLEKVFRPIIAALSSTLATEVRNVIVSGENAVIELIATATQKNGEPYRQEMCWVCRYEGDQIAELRYYADTATTERLLRENKE